jgi:two-component sensor histidine kinase
MPQELETQVADRTEDKQIGTDGFRQFYAQLLQTQDEERRRIARELHDSVGQLLAAISMGIGRLKADSSQLPLALIEAIADTGKLVQEATTDVRTISYLLHPPLLDDLGLSSALKLYIEGFEKRSNIKVTFEMSDPLTRLQPEVETALFRIVQECLTNVHRHSGSQSAAIRLIQRRDQVCLEVEDEGKGVSAENGAVLDSSLTGVGIRGMRERAAHLGGTLEMVPMEGGVLVRVTLPATSSHAVAARKSVLQICYQSPVLQARQMLLESDGYAVTSALENKEGTRLAVSGIYDVILVGFSADYSVRNQMVRWLKEHVPSTPVVVLLAHESEKFPEADCATMSEDPLVWLSAVRQTIMGI